jgi:peptidoglycan/LPS O-acetylase OafA/YrhL
MLVRLACLVIIFTAARTPGAGLQRVMVSRWLARIGVASYSIFLLHLQVLQVVTPIVTAAAGQVPILPLTAMCGLCDLSAVALACCVFYWVIERPFIAALRRA